MERPEVRGAPQNHVAVHLQCIRRAVRHPFLQRPVELPGFFFVETKDVPTILVGFFPVLHHVVTKSKKTMFVLPGRNAPKTLL